MSAEVKPSNSQRWLPRVESNPDAELRLFCLSYAGGGASVYYPWRHVVPDLVEVCPVQLPGREERVDEPCISEFDQVVELLAPVMGEYLDIPYMIYGHSMGAGLAFELSHRLLNDYDKPPSHLFVGAHRSPTQPYGYPSVKSTSEDVVLDVLSGFEGMPEAILKNRELLDLFLPILRSDLLVCETYRYRERTPLACPITLFTGRDDKNVTSQELVGWGDQTTGPFVHQELEAGHFFLKSHQKQLLELVGANLAGALENSVEHA
ncbi:thioesterase II family protein [Teredinibacter turnerae]|uniref:thioesterase II family protein n=1 Tax=Teredinibacter turnerae TaxID=2426 RepID=UPI0003643501|nr:thioesterase domain-containing protein [Teredinibacter turnerae]